MVWREILQEKLQGKKSSKDIFQLRKGEIAIEGYSALFSKLKKYTQITSFIFYGKNNIEDAEVIALAKRLKDVQITCLCFEKSKIGDVGAKALAEGLKGTQITRLTFKESSIGGDAGVKALVEGLKDTQITCFVFKESSIGGDAGIKALAEGLKGNTKIDTLFLSGNKIGDVGAKALAQCLNNTQIINFYMKAICRQEGEEAICYAVEKNRQRVRDVQSKFKSIFFKNEELSKKEKLELIEIIKEYGINAFLADIKAYEKKEAKKVTDKLIDVTHCHGFSFYNSGKDKEKQGRYEEAQEEYEKSIKHFKEALYLNDDNYSLHYGLARAYQACTKLESSKALSLLHYEKAIKKATKMGCDISNICFDRGKYLYEKANYKEAIESFDLLIEQKSDNPFFYILKANAHLKLWNQLHKTEAKNSEKNHQAAIANYRKSICKLSENQNGLSKENEAFIEKCLKHFIPVTQGSASDDRIQKVKNESIKVLLKLIETEEIRLNLKNQDEFMKIMRKEEDYVEILSLGIDKICEKDESLSALERDISQSIKKFYDSLPQPHITETASSKAAATGGSAALVSLGSTDSVGLAGEGELHWDAESFSSEDA